MPNIIDLWTNSAGFAKGIVVILIIMSIWSVSTFLMKWWQLRRSTRETVRFVPEFSRFLQEEHLDAAIALAEKTKKSHVARVLGEALAEVKPLLRDRATITAADINSAERAVERQMLIIVSELKRGLGILATIGATAPEDGCYEVVEQVPSGLAPVALLPYRDDGGVTWPLRVSGQEVVFCATKDVAGASGTGSIDGVSDTASWDAIAISDIDTAINNVSTLRSEFGAAQNRLDHRLNNLATYQENLVASESRIRDVDMASEMVNFTKLQILQQAGTSMLAQANQAPQGVLSLLR